jgi:hypothetical protein
VKQITIFAVMAALLLAACQTEKVQDGDYPVANLDDGSGTQTASQSTAQPQTGGEAQSVAQAVQPAEAVQPEQAAAQDESPEIAEAVYPDEGQAVARGLHGQEAALFNVPEGKDELAQEGESVPPAEAIFPDALPEILQPEVPVIAEPEPEPPAPVVPTPPVTPPLRPPVPPQTEKPPAQSAPKPPVTPPAAASQGGQQGQAGSGAVGRAGSAGTAGTEQSAASVPRKSGPPPPIPEPLRPSEPLPPPEIPYEAPAVTIPDLPARQAPSVDETIDFSRKVTAYVGQYIEIPFRGPGWVYLGELGSRRGVYYDSRRMDKEGMVFVFRADEVGVYSLKFNRQDFIRDTVLNDFVQVTVEEPPEITGSAWRSTAVAPDRVTANPRWPLPAAAQPAASGAPASAQSAAAPASTAAEATAQTSTGAAATPAATTNAPTTAPAPATAAATPTAAPPASPAPSPAAAATTTAAAATQSTELPEGALPDAYLARAKEEYDAGRIGSALDVLDRYKTAYPGGSDEAYWLYAQALEANGPNRDIALALDYYRRLVREYPQSERYDAARRRIAYLEKYYFNIQ